MGQPLSGRIAKSPAQRTASDNAFLLQTPKRLGYSSEQATVFRQLRQACQQAMQSYGAQQTGSMPQNAPITGTVRAPLILVQFPGKLFTRTAVEFQMLCNQLNYTATADGAITGSVRDYFKASSYNQLDFQVDVYGPFTMPNSIETYDHKSPGGNPRLMAMAAASAADAAGCDFSQYDVDNDGTVDGIHIIFAGYGQEAGEPLGTAIWSHAWAVPYHSLQLDGKYIYRYSCSPELRFNSANAIQYPSICANKITHVGVICHELSHVFGLPDLYDTDYEGSGGQSVDIDEWCIMAGGSWNGPSNNSGQTPAYHSAWCREQLGWITITELDNPDDVTVPNPASTGIAYKVTTPTSGEYFLLENRQKQDWDAYIPSSGLLIYHVDENRMASQGNDFNADPSHRGLYVKQAGCGINSNCPTNRQNDPYPYNANNSFTDTSIPNSKSWAGANTGKPITDITHNTSPRTITFKLMGGAASCPRPSDISAVGGSITASGATISWTPIGSETSWYFQYSVNSDFSSPTSYAVSTSSKAISGLNANTTYYIRVRSVCTSGNSVWREGSFTTLCEAKIIPYSEDFNDITPIDYVWEGNLPACWNSFTNNATYKAPHVIANGMYENWTGTMSSNALFFVNDINGNTSYAVLPELNTAYNLLQISFYVQWEDIRYGTLNLGYVTNVSNFSTSNSTFTSLKQIPTPTSANGAVFTEDLSVYYIPAGARLAFKFYYNNERRGLIIDNINIDLLPSCPQEPSGLTASSETTNGTTISWTAASPAPADGYEYYYSTTNTAPKNTVAIVPANVVSTTSKALTGLLSGTQYYFWLRSVCSISGNEKSKWTSSGTFATLCEAKTIPYSENFNDITPIDYFLEGYLPPCWNSFTNHTGYKAPHVIANGMYENSMGTMSSNALLFLNSTNGNTSYAVLPELNTALNLLKISFYVKWEHISYSGTLDLGYVTDASDFATSNSTFISLKQIPTTANTTIVTENLSTYTIPDGTRLAFKYYLHNVYYGLIIDDIYIDFLIVPPTVTTQAATSKTQTSAVLNKTVTSGEEIIISEEFKYKKVSETNWINSTDGILSGLSPNTEYEFYAYATTATYDIHGATLTFSTLAHTPPTVTTLPVADFDATSAILLKNVTAGTETITEQGFKYKKVSETTWENSADGILSGLSQNTEYEFYAYATTATFDIHGDTLIFSTTATGIADVLENSIILYPNPTDYELTISGYIDSKVSIIDISGKTITENCTVSANNSISVADLPQGIYFVKITNNNQIVLKKFIKK